ncbi:tetratricopeptide repeat protein [Nocardia sp. NPDC050712]|uniref:tetratricopeptide repeat protein n=1 Tax=Nocardia sp. NPDC050712 TaxID=3155518 RepID=UPI0033E2956C
MTAPESPGRDDVPAAVGLTRSSGWRRMVTAASLIGTGVVTKLLGDMMVKSLTEDSFLAQLGRALSGLWLGLLVLAAGFALYRWLESRREKARVAREVELLEQLVPPGANIDPLAHACPGPGAGPDPNAMTESNGTLYEVLCVLPFQEYDAAVLLTLVAAVAEIPLKTPGTRDPQRVEPAAARLLLRDLIAARGLHVGGGQGYCLDRRAGPVASRVQQVRESPAWQVVMSVLLHHWADLAGLWALGLEHRELAEGARRWFEYRDDFLTDLVDAAVAACGTSRPDALPRDTLPSDAVPAVARLIDALDVWKAVLGEPRYQVSADGWLRDQLTEPRLAWMRAGRLNERPRYRSRFIVAPARRARQLHQDALASLGAIAEPQASPELLDPVVRGLTRAWWRLPRTDTAGEVCAAINLAVAHLVQGRFEAAADRLDLAESLARRGDPGGLAHAIEIWGVLYWARGEPRRALTAWSRALESYRGLADNVGAGRCQQHIGSALVVAPQHAGVLMTPETGAGPTRDQAVRHAHARLDEALDLYPGARHVADYR